MRLPYLVRKVQRNVEDYRWGVTTKKSLATLVGWVYKHQVYRVYRIDFAITAPSKISHQHPFSFRILEATDNGVIEQIESFAEFLRGSVREKIADGALCQVAMDEQGKLAGFNLIRFGEVFIPLIELKRVFRPQEAWSEHIAVHKDHRRKGLASQLRYRVFEELRARGIKRLYGGTLRPNTPALKLTRKVGFTEIVDIDYIRFLNFRKWRYRRVRR